MSSNRYTCFKCQSTPSGKCFILDCGHILCTVCYDGDAEIYRCSLHPYHRSARITSLAFSDQIRKTIFRMADMVKFALGGKCNSKNCKNGATAEILICNHKLCTKCLDSVIEDGVARELSYVPCPVQNCHRHFPLIFAEGIRGGCLINAYLRRPIHEECSLNVFYSCDIVLKNDQRCNIKGCFYVNGCGYAVCYSCLMRHVTASHTPSYEKGRLRDMIECLKTDCKRMIIVDNIKKLLPKVMQEEKRYEVQLKDNQSRSSSCMTSRCRKNADISLTCGDSFCRSCILFSKVKNIPIDLNGEYIRCRVCRCCDGWIRESNLSSVQIDVDDFLQTTGTKCHVPEHGSAVLKTLCCNQSLCLQCLNDAQNKPLVSTSILGKTYNDVIKCTEDCIFGVPRRFLLQFVKNKNYNGATENDRCSTSLNYAFEGIYSLTQVQEDSNCIACRCQAIAKLRCSHVYCYLCLSRLTEKCQSGCLDEVNKSDIAILLERLDKNAFEESTRLGVEEPYIYRTETTQTTSQNEWIDGESGVQPLMQMKGVRNLGMTCYANSIFQILGQTNNFKETLKKVFTEAKQSDENLTLTDNLAVILELLNGNGDNETIDAMVNIFLEKMFSLEKSFEWCLMNDCFEFLMCLLKRLKLEDDKAVLMFENTIQAVFKYKPCGHTELGKPQKAYSLLIPISKRRNDTYSIESGFDDVFKTTTYSGEEVPCRKCNITEETERCLLLTKLPEILIIQIGRVKTRTTLYSSYAKKANETVFYHEEIEVAPTDEVKVKFRLYGVVLHSGYVDCGHYYSYVKKLKTDEWFTCNDSNVRSIEKKHVFHNRNAYMLFYEKEEP